MSLLYYKGSTLLNIREIMLLSKLPYLYYYYLKITKLLILYLEKI